MARATTDRFCASVHDGPVAAALGRSGREGPPHDDDDDGDEDEDEDEENDEDEEDYDDDLD